MKILCVFCKKYLEVSNFFVPLQSQTEKCGSSSVGRAQPCQGWGREFEPRLPLQKQQNRLSSDGLNFGKSRWLKKIHLTRYNIYAVVLLQRRLFLLSLQPLSGKVDIQSGNALGFDSGMRHLRTYCAVILLALFSCYYAGISLFFHTHIVNGSTVVHSHLGGSADHNHSDTQYAVIDILSTFQSEGAVECDVCPTPFFLLSDSCHEYQAPSVLGESVQALTLRGPPQA